MWRLNNDVPLIWAEERAMFISYKMIFYAHYYHGLGSSLSPYIYTCNIQLNLYMIYKENSNNL